LNEDELNFAVQKTIDRIIFLRMCEDRGVEPYGNLKTASEKGEVYQNLFELFRIADDKYNSGLFDFKEDRITAGLTIDNKVLKNIVRELYYPHCEYEFSVMPADILGSVYERFLGKTIRLTPAHHAKIEEKPEVRKAGGVYYTPKYVVDYIVENTVGRLIEGKTPKQVEALRICDPACGSGSFLIGAYQYLIEWHLRYYIENPPPKKNPKPADPRWQLDHRHKKTNSPQQYLRSGYRPPGGGSNQTESAAQSPRRRNPCLHKSANAALSRKGAAQPGQQH
jgi:adenine-specific DNA-methyltransferase